MSRTAIRLFGAVILAAAATAFGQTEQPVARAELNGLTIIIGRYDVKSYGQHGKRPSPDTTTVARQWTGRTPPLEKFDIAEYEFTARSP